ncbi:FLYWCH-type domain-containing protein [Aphis craccivora]|uniref:FLYWCH-type domain-containing protein n=1 Tax=Aphis craccivora TaxID=307492 RepID=A0A6G0YB08_APHCR|nr:FLYWCH-type domain-containing protein [Aphis craccivora]
MYGFFFYNCIVDKCYSRQIPSVSVLKRTVCRIRQKEQAAPPNQKTLLELIIPEDYRTTFDGKPFLLFDSDTWIGRLDRRNRRKLALFPATLWNCHIYIFENIPRTNNSVEGWHNGFASSLMTKWKCIDSFKKEESLMELQIEQLPAGMTMGVKRKYKDHAEKIIKICDD